LGNPGVLSGLLSHTFEHAFRNKFIEVTGGGLSVQKVESGDMTPSFLLKQSGTPYYIFLQMRRAPFEFLNRNSFQFF
jgi:hypothetical protein